MANCSFQLRAGFPAVSLFLIVNNAHAMTAYMIASIRVYVFDTPESNMLDKLSDEKYTGSNIDRNCPVSMLYELSSKGIK